MRTGTAQTGQWLRELREAQGLSPEEVPYAMLRAKIERRAIPCARTIRRAEAESRLPHVRYRFGLAQFYGVDYSALWPVTTKRSRVAA